MTSATTPAHRQPRLLALVMVGGIAGTLARWWLGRLLGVRDGWPAGTLAANLAGALLLGWLLESLVRREGGPRAPHVRLLLGTGFCGAFTTMSSLALETTLLVDAHRPGLALAYLAVSLVGGALLAWLGIVLAGGGRR